MSSLSKDEIQKLLNYWNINQQLRSPLVPLKAKMGKYILFLYVLWTTQVFTKSSAPN